MPSAPPLNSRTDYFLRTLGSSGGSSIEGAETPPPLALTATESNNIHSCIARIYVFIAAGLLRWSALMSGHLNNGSWLAVRKCLSEPTALIGFSEYSPRVPEAYTRNALGMRSLYKTDRRLSQSGWPYLATGNLIG